MAINTYISEEIIEKQLKELEDEAFGQQWMEDLLQKEPILAGFLFSEDLKILEDEEQSFYAYLVVAIWSSVATNEYASAQCEPERIDELEEKNWEVFSNAKGDFRSKMDGFFESFPQEDLMALIEDMLESESEDEFLTKEGKELVLIKTKTMLDVLILPAN